MDFSWGVCVARADNEGSPLKFPEIGGSAGFVL
jgi:hypothetical protein